MTIGKDFAMSTQPLAAMFISHGARLFAIEPGTSGLALTRWGASLAPAIRWKILNKTCGSH